jgi:undecaprenyl-diphosphatase
VECSPHTRLARVASCRAGHCDSPDYPRACTRLDASDLASNGTAGGGQNRKCIGRRYSWSIDVQNDESARPLVLVGLELGFGFVSLDQRATQAAQHPCVAKSAKTGDGAATPHRCGGGHGDRVVTSPELPPSRRQWVFGWLKKLVTYWTLIVVVTAIAIFLFADLGEDVAHKSTGPLDNSVRAWFLAHQNTILYKISYAFTWIGSPEVMILIAIVAGAWFYRSWGRRKAGVVIAAPAAGGVLSTGVKLVYGRTRPAGAALLNERTFSFPSGHATMAAAVMVTLCYVLAREKILSWPAAILIGGLVPLVVGLTRLYLDVHWTTDVLGGWTAGLFIAALSAALYERLRSSAPPSEAIESVKPAP